MRKCRRLKIERGVILVFFAIVLALLIFFVLVLVATGFLSKNRAAIQNLANYVSLAAIQAFVRTEDNYVNKQAAALARANEVFGENNLTGTGLALGGIQASDLEFGVWYEEMSAADPCGGSYPCFIANTSVPPSNWPNSVRVTVRNQDDNLIVAPLAGVIGQVEASSIAAVVPRCMAGVVDLSLGSLSQTHTVISRITELGARFAYRRTYLLAGEVYPFQYSGFDYWLPRHINGYPFSIQRPIFPVMSPPQAPNLTFLDPPPPAAFTFAYRNSLVSADCRFIQDYDGLTWCNTLPTRGKDGDDVTPLASYQVGNVNETSGGYAPFHPATYPAGSSQIRFRSDYLPPGAMSSNFNMQPYRAGFPFPDITDQVIVDYFINPAENFFGPQPFSRFLSAINAGFQLMQTQFTPEDRAVIIGSAGATLTVVPTTADGVFPSNLTSDLQYLMQVTNPENRGLIVWDGANYQPYVFPAGHQYAGQQALPLYPNFVSVGLVPFFTQRPSYSASNLILAIRRAMEILGECPTLSRKAIILVTDSPVDCYSDPSAAPGSPGLIEEVVNGSLLKFTCDPALFLSSYVNAENEILGPLADELISRRIAVTAVIEGEHALPNFRNRTRSAMGLSPSQLNGTSYITTEEARALRLGRNFFDANPRCPPGICTDTFAFRNIGRPGFAFPRAVAMWGELSLRTGGIPCPILKQAEPADCPSCGGSCYEPDPINPSAPERLRDCARGPDNSTLELSLLNLNREQQAAYCVRKTIGEFPYALKVEEN